eukprot:GGOE01015372.1.p1 GENE.GGOE01015372.1~~GGOE01015372.1.p1  ORF type:complete len:753 (-),score=127.90 GGOE01015372.1:182-2287(-)
MCHQWMVLRGPLARPQLVDILHSAPDWCLAIIAEHAGPHARAVLYVTPTMRSGFQIAPLLPQDLLFWKNVAYLHAIRCGARVIYDTDRHHVATVVAAGVGQMHTWEEEPHVENWTWATASGVLNLYPIFLGQRLWPRGFPPQLLHDRQPPKVQSCEVNGTVVTVDVTHLVPATCVDVAAGSSSGFVPVPGKQPQRFAVAPGEARIPFNSRSTVFERAAFWALLLPISVQPCISDVWRAFILQRVMSQTHQAVGFTGPWMAGSSPCSSADHGSECPNALYADSQKLVNVLRDSSSTLNVSSMEDLLPQLARHLVRHFLLRPANVDLVTAWVADLKALGYRFPAVHPPSVKGTAWPDLRLFLPLHSSHFTMFRDIFWNSTLRFWPEEHLRMTIMADAEDEALRPVLRQFLSGLSTTVRRAIHVAHNPLLPLYRRGHDRQQFFMFFADHYSDAEYIGFVDTDCLFVTPVVRSDLFVDGKPIIIGVIGRAPVPGMEWWDMARYSTYFLLGKREVVRGMNYFPVIIHRSHLRELRAHVERLHGNAFGEVFHRNNVRPFSQFTIMVTYLWYFHRDEYTWHLEDRRPGQGPYGVTDFEAVGLLPEHLRPKARVAVHFPFQRKPPGGAAAMMQEGSCRAGLLPPRSCTAYDMGAIHRDLFVFEGHAWFDVADCQEANTEHYAEVHAALSMRGRRGRRGRPHGTASSRTP